MFDNYPHHGVGQTGRMTAPVPHSSTDGDLWR